MKKLIAILLSLTFVLSVSAFATIITPGNSDFRTVTATHRATDAPVYSIDISWGSMEFVYAENSLGIWNPETHEFSAPVNEGWIYPTDTSTGLAANEIRITNHSNAEISYELSFSPSTTLNSADITYSLNNNIQTIESAVGTTPENAPFKKASLTLTGANPYENQITLGTITIDIRTG